MTKSKKIMIGALPFAALIVLFAVFCGIVSSKGYRLDMYIKIIFSVCSLSNLFFRFHTTTLTEACSNELKQHHL